MIGNLEAYVPGDNFVEYLERLKQFLVLNSVRRQVTSQGAVGPEAELEGDQQARVEEGRSKPSVRNERESSKCMAHVDALSRLPTKSNSGLEEYSVSSITVDNDVCISVDEIANSLKADVVLYQVYHMKA
ncbi:hypothetical protein QE152_g13891 [Popillia japonica]|uniref:Uncharacterized protein n=1 Tax=Popillia japonica TaxID=7064 RepID=A0AAW1LBL6_POPJA